MAPPRLNTVNLLTYVANVIVTYGSQMGWFGATNQQQSLKYQTLATPIGFAFAIWGPIFILQAVFSMVQLMPKYQSSSVVTDGVSYWYVAACAAQAGWTVAFAQDIVWLSMIFMLAILATLTALNFSVVRTVARQPADEMHPALCYVCFRAPFVMHLGWITAATFVNANVAIVKYAEHDRTLQLGAAIATIALLLLPGLYNPATSSNFSSDPLYSLVLVSTHRASNPHGRAIHAPCARRSLRSLLSSTLLLPRAALCSDQPRRPSSRAGRCGPSLGCTRS